MEALAAILVPIIYFISNAEITAKIHTGGFSPNSQYLYVCIYMCVYIYIYIYTHTQDRVLRGSMEETLEAGRTLSLPCR